jgi:hypothetical protein
MCQHSKNKVAFIGIFCSVIIVLLSIAHTNQFNLDLDNWGLIKVLPVTYILGVVLFSIFHLYIMFNSKSYFVNIVCVLLLIIILFGTATLLEGTPRFEYTYKASANIDYIVRSGHSCVDWSVLDANSRFQHWPSVYYFSAIMLILSTIDINTLLLLTPVTSQILYLFPLLLIFKRILSESKRVFIACSLFFLMNWVNQDFLSNQNIGLFFSLLVLSILILIQFNMKYSKSWIILFLGTFFCVVISHGLSSIATLAYVLSFLVVILVGNSILWHGRSDLKSAIKPKQSIVLILFMLTIFLSWATYIVDIQLFSSGLRGITSTSLSNLFSHYTASLQLADRGTYVHIILAKVKTYYAAIFSTIALLGLFHYLLSIKFNIRKVDVPTIFFTCILFVNFMLYISGLYGDEAIIRAFLLSLISLVYFCTHLINSKKLYLLLLVIFVISMPMHILLHYSNENENYITPTHISSTSFLYQNSNNGAIVLGSCVEARKNFERYSFRALSYKRIDGSYDFQICRGQNEMVYIFIPDRSKDALSAQAEYEIHLSQLYNLIYTSGTAIYSWER